MTHANNIDAIRLILALMVVTTHAFMIAAGSQRAAEYDPLFRLVGISTAEVGLDSFFCLSGYLIAQSWDRAPRIGRFLRSRVARIYPGFLAAFVISVLAAGVQPSSWSDLVARAALLRMPDLPGSYPFNRLPGLCNASLWSISWEFVCYLIVLVLGCVGVLRRRWVLLGLTVAAVLIGAVLLGAWVVWGRGRFMLYCGDPLHWARLIPLYLGGSVFYVWRDRILLTWSGALLALAGLLVTCRDPTLRGLYFPFGLTYFLLWASFTSAWSWRSATRFGDLSYGIYLYSFPIQQQLAAHFPSLDPWLLCWASFPLSILAGLASYQLVERRFLRRRAG